MIAMFLMLVLPLVVGFVLFNKLEWSLGFEAFGISFGKPFLWWTSGLLMLMGLLIIVNMWSYSVSLVRRRD